MLRGRVTNEPDDADVLEVVKRVGSYGGRLTVRSVASILYEEGTYSPTDKERFVEYVEASLYRLVAHEQIRIKEHRPLVMVDGHIDIFGPAEAEA